ncbi:DUF3618 domain-containing protein [Cellulomonas bogoriensis]|uniref:Membrane protein n=1 Tax=Cellulomonas bogoriensis 69B4 = DSM 16987 TaxID=1386082 RepID=A0A0A0C207_9CELL|nr:DUF3618 domain-containing protein [Cellulomonas bogoriensis]KGM14190.1 membrane protein [Cellulomonas bogoriensis 69B4 = DSM 16987]
MSPTTPDAAEQDTRSPAQIEADIARTRQEIKLAVDELSNRLDPRVQAKAVGDETRAAAADLRRRLAREPRGLTESPPTTRGWVVLGVGAALTALVLTAVVRRL